MGERRHHLWIQLGWTNGPVSVFAIKAGYKGIMHAHTHRGINQGCIGRILLQLIFKEQSMSIVKPVGFDARMRLPKESTGVAGKGVVRTLGCLGITELRLGNLSQAQRYIHENLFLATSTLIFLPIMVALTGVALLRAEQGDAESSIQLYTTALQNGHVANSHWYSDVTQQMLDAAIGIVPPEVVVKAEARGKERTWQFVLAEL